MKQLFDENGLLNIADIIKNHPSYLSIMEDGIVTDKELSDHVKRTIESIRKLQMICNKKQQDAFVEALSELNVLYALYRNYEIQNFKF